MFIKIFIFFLIPRSTITLPCYCFQFIIPVHSVLSRDYTYFKRSYQAQPPMNIAIECNSDIQSTVSVTEYLIYDYGGSSGHAKCCYHLSISQSWKDTCERPFMCSRFFFFFIVYITYSFIDLPPELIYYFVNIDQNCLSFCSRTFLTLFITFHFFYLPPELISCSQTDIL